MNSIPIRPHHGVCLAYYQGYGYSQDFNTRMKEMQDRFLTNPTVRITCQSDEICVGCPHRMGQSCETEQKTRGYDQAVMDLCGLREGQELSFFHLASRIQTRILDRDLRAGICGDCQWTPLCSGRSRWKELEQTE